MPLYMTNEEGEKHFFWRGKAGDVKWGRKKGKTRRRIRDAWEEGREKVWRTLKKLKAAAGRKKKKEVEEGEGNSFEEERKKDVYADAEKGNPGEERCTGNESLLFLLSGRRVGTRILNSPVEKKGSSPFFYGREKTN